MIVGMWVAGVGRWWRRGGEDLIRGSSGDIDRPGGLMDCRCRRCRCRHWNFILPERTLSRKGHCRNHQGESLHPPRQLLFDPLHLTLSLVLPIFLFPTPFSSRSRVFPGGSGGDRVRKIQRNRSPFLLGGLVPIRPRRPVIDLPRRRQDRREPCRYRRYRRMCQP